MSKKAIEVIDLVKTYRGNIEAVKGINFYVNEGEFYAFIGPNGAGKSTTIKMLTTLIRPTSGQIQIAGYDPLKDQKAIRMKIGVALQTKAIDPQLTGREMLQLQGHLFGLSKREANGRAEELLETVKLTKDADRPCGKYSGGMQRRLDLALTLVHKPEILFLDEPTVGLDPPSRIDLWREIRNLNEQFGTTVFLTTQYLEEVDKVADHVSIINNGTIVASGKAHELKRDYALDKIMLAFESDMDNKRAKEVLTQITKNIDVRDNQLDIFIENSRAHLPVVIKKLAEAQLYPKDIDIKSATLDDVFIHVTRSQQNTSYNCK